MTEPTSSGRFAPHQVQHLVLLVGENPLPNAVAGRLLVAPGGQVVLVHSPQTHKEAHRLEEYLRQYGVRVASRREVDPTSPQPVFRGVQAALGGAAGSVGIHYTGGTKVMATHAYRAGEAWAAGNCQPVLFSYLDPARREVVFTHSGRDTEQRVPVEGSPLKVSVKELGALHGCRELSNGTRDVLWPESVDAIARTMERVTVERWTAWRVALENCETPPPTPMIHEIERVLRDEAGLGDYPLILGNLARAGRVSSDEVKLWLRGGWLEYHVLRAVQSIAEEIGISDFARSYHVGSSESETAFEIDVVAMRGYQLFAFSCTASHKSGSCKAKLLEAQVRARQLGGDEAAVALVCLANEEERGKLRAQLRENRRVAVFGLAQLASLDIHISQWVRDQIQALPEAG